MGGTKRDGDLISGIEAICGANLSFKDMGETLASSSCLCLFGHS